MALFGYGSLYDYGDYYIIEAENKKEAKKKLEEQLLTEFQKNWVYVEKVREGLCNVKEYTYVDEKYIKPLNTDVWHGENA